MKESLEEEMDKHVSNSFEWNEDLHITFFFFILKLFKRKYINYCCC